MRADPGIGDEAAPVGSVEWAQWMRLDLQSAWHHVGKVPEYFANTWTFAFENRAWTLMNKPDGSTFTEARDFAEHPEPWGLGAKYEDVLRVLEFSMGKEAAGLATVSEAKVPVPPMKGKPGPGRGHKTESDILSDSVSGTHSGAEARAEERQRAIALRAPKPVQDLVKAGLLRKDIAAKLGPHIGKQYRERDPEGAARVEAHVAEVARVLAAEAKALPTATPAEKEAAKRALNAKARTLLGAPSNLVTSAKAAIARWSREATEDEWRQIVKALDDADTRRASHAE